MCVILYAPPKKQIKEKFLKTAFENNPDGAGIMHYDFKGRVHYKKGFMSYEEMKNYWDSLDDRLARAVHCRIATSGEITEQNCHPFPIVSDVESMKSLEGISKTGCVMHNGILKDYAPRDGLKSDFSDTMAFNGLVLCPIVLAGCIENDGVKRLIDGLDNAFLLFLPNYKVIMYGDWIKDRCGFYASNDSYSDTFGFGLFGVKEEDFYEYDRKFIQETFPRYSYVLEFHHEGKDFPYFLIDDLVDDLCDFVVSIDQPYCTYYQVSDGVYRLELDTYDDVSYLLPSAFKVIKQSYYPSDKETAL